MGISYINFFPTKMFSKGEIDGDKIDYEDYLLELVNTSDYFMGLTSGEKFEKIVEQDNGQADFKTSNYELDFKLFANQDFVNNKLKSLPEVDYSHKSKGIILVSEKPMSQSKMTPAQANSLFVKFFQVISKATSEQFKDFEADKNSELYSTIKMFKKNKNLLFLFPFEISCPIDEVVATVERFANIFSLRDGINKDTFVVVLRKDSSTAFDEFFILKYADGKFSEVDRVNRLFVTSFNYIYTLTSFTENL